MSSADRRLVYATAPGCGVCREKEPVAEQIAAALGLELERVDTATEEGAARYGELRLRGVPTLALLQGDRVPFRLVGRMITPETVDQMMERL
jgi:thiol-disulfide isomerase/thioredoxin